MMNQIEVTEWKYEFLITMFTIGFFKINKSKK